MLNIRGGGGRNQGALALAPAQAHAATLKSRPGNDSQVQKRKSVLNFTKFQRTENEAASRKEYGRREKPALPC